MMTSLTLRSGVLTVGALAAMAGCGDSGGTTGAGGGTGTGGASTSTTTTTTTTTTGTGGGATGTGGSGGGVPVDCSSSTARQKAHSLITGDTTGPGTMTLVAPGCTAPTPVTYADDARGEVPAPSLTDFHVLIDPDDSAKWYDGASQGHNFGFAGSGDDEEEYLAPKAGTFAGGYVVDDVFANFDAAKAHALLRITLPQNSAAPCDTTAGFTISVTGHAEATVTYLLHANNQLSISSSTTTVTSGNNAMTVVAIENLTPGGLATVVGTKTGCKINPIVRPMNDLGTIPLEAGRVVAMPYQVAPM